MYIEQCNVDINILFLDTTKWVFTKFVFSKHYLVQFKTQSHAFSRLTYEYNEKKMVKISVYVNVYKVVMLQ